MSKELERKLTDKKAGNQRREKELNQKGMGITPAGILQLNLEALKQLVFDLSEDPDVELKFNVKYQEVLSDFFDTMEEHAKTQARASGLLVAQQELPADIKNIITPGNNGHP